MSRSNNNNNKNFLNNTYLILIYIIKKKLASLFEYTLTEKKICLVIDELCSLFKVDKKKREKT